ncbi:MAG: cell division protein FtsK [Micavibrio aeruginosavorus]|uniref:Cell division protein FtsK n=1 Tax=Micavibrio aeruginosavorus TaxID=349221 RepID=A0A2W5FR60_9BACT|nr:MAG: cell division protein FtsK [Micavibrio aeruginosavorus]
MATASARRSSVKNQSRFFRFLPASWQAYLGERAQDGFAVAVFLSGIFITLALLTYNSADPSMSTASGSEDIHNLMGSSGATVADLLLQIFGIGAFVFAVGFATWGLRLWRREDFGPLWLRASTILSSALLLSIAGAAVPAFILMPHATMGGGGGNILLNNLELMTGDFLPLARYVLGFLAAILGLLSLNFGLALRQNERQAMVASMLYGSSVAAESASTIWGRLSAFFSPPEVKPVKKRAQKAKVVEEETGDEDEYEEAYEDEYEEEEEPAAKAGIKVVKPQKAKATTPKAKPTQARLDLRDPSEWELPSVDLLQEHPDQGEAKVDESALRKNAEMLNTVLQDYNVTGEIESIHPGPVVTLYELEPSPGTKTSRVVGLSDDIARSMSAVSVRVAVVPGRNVIGIELPNKKRQTVYFRELMESDDVEKSGAKLPLVLGKDIGGQPIIADLTKMPHLLVAGTTGSGKSVAVNTMILSLLYKLPPEKCRFIMIDPKMLELSIYDDIPHLLSPVVTEPGRAIVALKWTVQEMENRYRNMSKLGVRNIDGYNQRLKEARKKGEVLMRKVQTGFDAETGKPVYEEQPLDLTELPYIVVIVDEFADLMLVAGKDVENAIQRLAQMARAAGIHLIMATQRPSVDVITGVIKANFPTRISFQVTSKIDSRTILGEGGAETLLGMGDMLYMAAGGRLTRVHGPFVSDREVEDVVNYLKAQGEPEYLEEITEGDFEGGEFGEGGDRESSGDELYDQAVALVAREQKASTSFIQRHLQIGYNRAARIIEQMEKEGVVGKANHVGKREVLVGAR